MKNIIKPIISTVLVAAFVIGCNKDNEYMPPEWNYDIPHTELQVQTQLGAIYHNKVDINWTSAQGYTPVLNLVEEDGEVVGTMTSLLSSLKWLQKQGSTSSFSTGMQVRQTVD